MCQPNPSLDIAWNKWTKHLENLFIAMKITEQPRKKAMLLHYAGEDVNDIYETRGDTDTTYDAAKAILDAYFTPKKSSTFEVYNFRKLKQDDDGKRNTHAVEIIDQYVARLRTVGVRCEFADMNREIKDQIVLNCKSNTLRREALRDDLSLDDLF